MGTSDKPFAGTNETVNLWLTGSTGKCKGPLAIRDAKKSLLERNQKNEIIIDLSENIGDLQKAQLSFANPSAKDKWHVESIELWEVEINSNEVKPSSTVNFNFNTWVKPGEIYEAARQKVEPKKYSVKIQAEKTDSKDSLFINIRGTRGETQKRKIGSNFKKQ